MKLRSTVRAAMHCFAGLCALPGLAAAQTLAPPAGQPAGRGADQTFDWTLDAGVQHSDNIERTEVDEQSESIAIAGVTLLIAAERPRLDADIGANLQYRDYLDETFQSELVGGLSGLVSYALIPERLSWMIADNYGQVSNDRTAVETPANRQNVNYLTTGPDLTFGFGGRTGLRLSGRYSDMYYEDSPEDSQSLTGSLALIREVSDTTRWSLNGSNTKVEYDEEVFGEYEIREGFVRLEARGARTTLSGDVGYTTVDQDSDSSDGLLARAEVSRQVLTRSRIALQAGTEFSTAADTFRRDQRIVGVETGNEDAIVASDPLQSDYVYLLWNTDWPRGAFGAVLSVREESHETFTVLDRELHTATVSLSREVARRLGAELFGGYTKEKFVNANFEFDEWSAGVGFTWRFAQQLSLRLRVEHMEGSSSAGNRDYEENRGYLGIAYSRGGS